MHSNQSDRKAPARGFSAAIRYGLIALVSVVGAGFGASACLVRPLCDQDCRPRTTNIFVDTITQKTVDKIDLLFMIDNSLSMADKQQVLKAAVPDLVTRLVSPNCVSPTDGSLVPGTPADPNAPCPGTSVREFKAITDIHIGVITSSLGGHGSTDTCVGNDSGNLSQQEQDDHGHLIASRPRWTGESAKNYANAAFQQPEPAGYLNWNPKTPGHGDINLFNTTFQMMVTASSEFGCGLESQLEAIYRFLSDPNPPQSVSLQACQTGTTAMCAFPSGKDTTLLAQRAAFLRPDSLVAVIMVTDENDCSIRNDRQFYYASTQKVTIPQGSAICATNPNDPCCYSCGSSSVPAGCQPDPTCKTQPANWRKLDDENLRCFEEKRRFGMDFLYPTARYVNMLKQTQICTSREDLDASNTADSPCPDADHNNAPDIVPNPLYSDLTGGAALPRAPNLVFFAGIVGVPWQDIQATTNNALMPPAAYPANELHYQTAKDLLANKVWDAILGNSNPGGNVPPIPPTDNLMVESTQPRGGNDGTGKPLAGPQVPPSQDNAINGHEWGDTGNSDLMYACIFKLTTSRDCTAVEAAGAANPPTPGCDCGATSTPADFNPLCEDPNGVYGHTQFKAKGYPGLRELQVLKDYGDNSIVASICARNLDPSLQATSQDWGYRPAVDAIVDRLKEALTGRCLPRKLAPDPQTGKIPCSIIEVRAPGSDPACPAQNGRATVTAQLEGPALQTMRDKGICGDPPLAPCTSFPLCQILEAGPPCHQKEGTVQPMPGWCYVDPLANPGVDDPSLVSKCPASEQRIIRFVGDQTPAQGAQVLIACFGAQLDQTTTKPTGAAGAAATGAGGDTAAAAGGAATVGAGGGP